MRSYDRIAGYFSSSILEVAREAFEWVQGTVRVVCNSHLSRADAEVARAARAAMRREWCESRPEALGDAARPRFRRLYENLRSGKLAVRVLPDDAFGLIHGKAGVITLADGRRTSFLGSAAPVPTATTGVRRTYGDSSPAASRASMARAPESELGIE